MNLKQLIQAQADGLAAIAKLRREGRELFALETRTPEQDARLKAVLGTELTALENAQETIESNLATARRLQDEERKAPAAATAPVIQMGVDHATEKPWAGLGEFLQAVSRADSNQGIDPRLMASISGASTSVPADGGHLVRQDWTTALLQKAASQAVLAPKCFTVPVGDGFDGVEGPVIDETSRATGSRWGGVRVYRSAEADSVTSSKPKLGRFELKLEDLTGLAYATNRSLQDASALQSIIERSFSEEFAFVLDNEIYSEDGVAKCLGVTNANNGALVTVNVESGQTLSNPIETANLAKMWARMPSRLKGGAEWFYNAELAPYLHEMTQPAGTAGTAPRFVSYDANGSLRIFGRPATELDQAQAPGTKGDISLLNLNEYLLISKGGVQSDSSMHVRFIYHEMTFRFITRVNGKPTWRTTMTPFKGSNVQSPFVVLNTRS